MTGRRIHLAKSFLTRQPDTRSYPAVIGIESTGRCNIDCYMCPRQEMTRGEGDMDMDLYRRIIDDVGAELEFVWLQHYGEPFLHKGIFDMIRYAKAAGLRTGISTNATVLGESIIDGIFSAGLDYIILAFDGATKETYEKIRVGAKFDRVIGNIRNFLDEKVKRGEKIFTVVQCIYMDDTENEIKAFKRIWDVPGVDGIRIRQVTYSGEGRFSNWQETKPCYWLWSDPHIKWDGTVVPCCQDVNGVYALGNMRDNTLGELWNSKKMQDLRRMHIEGRGGEVELCKGCNMYQPSAPLIMGSSLLSYYNVNRLVPKVETMLSSLRY